MKKMYKLQLDCPYVSHVVHANMLNTSEKITTCFGTLCKAIFPYL